MLLRLLCMWLCEPARLPMCSPCLLLAPRILFHVSHYPKPFSALLGSSLTPVAGAGFERFQGAGPLRPSILCPRSPPLPPFQHMLPNSAPPLQPAERCRPLRTRCLAQKSRLCKHRLAHHPSNWNDRRQDHSLTSERCRATCACGCKLLLHATMHCIVPVTISELSCCSCQCYRCTDCKAIKCSKTMCYGGRQGVEKSRAGEDNASAPKMQAGRVGQSARRPKARPPLRGQD